MVRSGGRMGCLPSHHSNDLIVTIRMKQLASAQLQESQQFNLCSQGSPRLAADC